MPELSYLPQFLVSCALEAGKAACWKRVEQEHLTLKKNTHTHKYVTRTQLGPGSDSLLFWWVIKTTLAPLQLAAPAGAFSAHDLWSQWPFLGLVLGPFHCVGAEGLMQLVFLCSLAFFGAITPKSPSICFLDFWWSTVKGNACGEQQDRVCWWADLTGSGEVGEEAVRSCRCQWFKKLEAHDCVILPSSWAGYHQELRFQQQWR